MSPKIKNIIIFVSIGLALILIYIFFIKSDPVEDNLITYPNFENDVPLAGINTGTGSDQDFLPLLLSVKSIRLNDAIFSDPAFMGLVDSTIILIPDGNEGRPNPFADFGAEENINNSPSSN